MRRLLLAVLLASCADSAVPSDSSDLPLGDVEGDTKADGNGWGSALTCKAIPDLPSLVSPRITVSLNGLTLHLTDPATGYDKVFPIGPGKIDQDESDPEYGESLSYRPIIDRGTGDFAITPSSSVACKTWWTDPESGERSPVFAGLPFMSWNGNYAIHGPIDNFRATNGGTLRRGYVSHGCIRMEAADILEIYARIHTVARVPVHVQREPERNSDGGIVDIPTKWVGSSCTADADCSFTGGYCATNPVSHTGFCSAHCTQYCADKTGYPSTFCVADPANADAGMCVPRALDVDFGCRPYDHMTPQVASRFHSTVTANVCLPHSPGWIGDHCSADGDCNIGLSCKSGICTQACAAICPDQPGWAETTCVSDPAIAPGGSCLRRCTPSTNASECPLDMQCAAEPRAAVPSETRTVCVPR